MDTFERHGGDYKVYNSSRAITSAFPSLRPPDRDSVGILDMEGGVIMADKALQAARRAAVDTGRCAVMDGFKVLKVEVGGDNSVTVVGEGGKVVRAKGVVLCAGPWTQRLIQPLGWVKEKF